MAHVLPALSAYSSYKDNRSPLSLSEQHTLLASSATLYVGNLSFYTTEEQIYELFSKAGDVKRVIMGLDRNTKSPCGFCFVEYFRPEHAINCLRYISGTKLDERIIRADLDPGYKEGRQYGRGKSGGQVRDEFRADFDAGRGGWGRRAIEEQEMERARQEWQDEIYRSDHFGGAGRDVPMGEMVDRWERNERDDY